MKRSLLLTIYQTLRWNIRYMILNILSIGARPANGIHILNGHMVDKENPDIRIFEKLMAELSEYAEFIRIEDAVAKIEAHNIPDRPLIAFTFDDGFEECYTCIAPVLEKYHTNAAFFINPGFISGDAASQKAFVEETVLSPGKRPLTWEQLKDLQERGHIIGAHTMDHYIADINDENELKHQIIDCKLEIERHLGTKCSYFAWPFGKLKDTDTMAIEMVCRTFPHAFNQSYYRHYFSCGGRILNRRHFEPFWPISHTLYFLSKKIK